MNDSKFLVAYLAEKGNTNIAFDGAWITWIDRNGRACYASKSDIREGWKRGR